MGEKENVLLTKRKIIIINIRSNNVRGGTKLKVHYVFFWKKKKKVPRRLKSFEKVGEGEGITSNEYQILQDIEKAVNKLGEKVHFILLNKLFPT